jgi:hypothetical protein
MTLAVAGLAWSFISALRDRFKLRAKLRAA